MFPSAVRRTVARIALAAMLFSVATPTLAAALFAHRADVGARILGVPAAAAPAPSHDGAPHEHGVHSMHAGHSMPGDQHLALPADEGAGGEHAAHGVYCSFCLTASSVVALTGGIGESGVVTLRGAPAPAAAESVTLSLLPLVLRARGPPPFPRS